MSALRRWLLDPVPMHGMVICRIGLGGVLVVAYLMRWPLVDILYGPDGYGGWSYFQRFPESGSIGWAGVMGFDLLRHVESGALVWVLYAALIANAACFALGVWPRVTGTAALILHALFLGRNPGATWGWGTMIKPFLLYAILASSGPYASLPAWLRRRRGEAGPTATWTAPAWPLRLLQVHVTCVFLALWSRVDEGSWLSGQMLVEALVNRNWGRFDVDWVPWIGLIEIGGKAALVLELGAAVALWVRPIARYWALALMGMFATLVVTTSVGWWDFMMFFTLAVFLPERWLAIVLRRLGAPQALPPPGPDREPTRAADSDS